MQGTEMLGKETIDAFNTSDTRGNSPSYGTTFQKMGHELLSRDEMDCLKDRRYAAAKESGEFYTVSEIESSLFNYVPRTYTIYYRRGSRRLTFGVRTRTTGNLLEMGSREYFIGPTGKREQIVKDLDTLMKEVKKYARFDKVLVQAINGEPVKK